MPAWHRIAHGDSGERTGHSGEFRDAGRVREDMTDTSAVYAVLKIGFGKERRRRRDDEAKLDRGEQRLPERHLVAEHQHQAVAASRAEVVQEICDAIRCGREVRE
jgi:hypothetical protein